MQMEKSNPRKAYLIIATVIALLIPSQFCSLAQDFEARPPEAPVPGGVVPQTTQSSPPAPAPQLNTSQVSSPPSQPSSNNTDTQSAVQPEQGKEPVTSSAPAPGTYDKNSMSRPGRLLSVISAQDAQTWVTVFKNQARTPSPQLLEQLSGFYEWMLELLDEHNRLYATFGKNENTRLLSNTEKQTVAKLNHLKNEVLLLRAGILIRLNRPAEAIVPLVDIVNAEPQTAAGKEAYRDLQDIGFSEIPDLSTLPVASTPPTNPTPLTKQTPPTKPTPTTKQTPAGKQTQRARHQPYRVH